MVLFYHELLVIVMVRQNLANKMSENCENAQHSLKSKVLKLLVLSRRPKPKYIQMLVLSPD